MLRVEADGGTGRRGKKECGSEVEPHSKPPLSDAGIDGTRPTAQIINPLWSGIASQIAGEVFISEPVICRRSSTIGKRRGTISTTPE
jgi:hypothetical protein